MSRGPIDYQPVGSVAVPETPGEPAQEIEVGLRYQGDAVHINVVLARRGQQPHAGTNLTLDECFDLIGFLTEAAMEIDPTPPRAMAHYGRRR